MNDLNIKKRLEEDFDLVSKKYEIIGVFLQGSQNYNLSTEKSDIDTKAIILPSFDDIVLNNKPVSYTHVLPSDEHIDIKDIRLMFDCFRKQNINFVEILFTKYFILNDKYKNLYQPMLDHAEEIAHYNNFAAVNCISGMSQEKYHALEHPYPSKMDLIEKYHFDPKQLHHIVRLNEFLKRYINGEKFSDCLISKNAEELIKIKNDPTYYTLEEARTIAKEKDQETYEIKKEYMENHKLMVNQETKIFMDQIIVNILRKYLKEVI